MPSLLDRLFFIEVHPELASCASALERIADALERVAGPRIEPAKRRRITPDQVVEVSNRTALEEQRQRQDLEETASRFKMDASELQKAIFEESEKYRAKKGSQTFDDR